MFDGKTEKFELFGDFFPNKPQNSQPYIWRQQNQLLPLSHETKCAAGIQKHQQPKPRESGRNVGSFPWGVRETSIIVSSGTQIPRTCLQLSKPKFSWFSWWASKLGQKRIRINRTCHAMQQFKNAKMPPHLKKRVNQAHSEKSRQQQSVAYLEMELGFYGLIAPDEYQVNTVSRETANTNADRPRRTCHQWKKPGHYRNQCRQLRIREEPADGAWKCNETKISGFNNFIPSDKNTNNNKSNNNNYKNSNRPKKISKLFTQLMSSVKKTNQSTEKCYFGANAANRPPSLNRRSEGQNQVQHINNQNKSNGSAQSVAQKKLELPRLHSGTAIDRLPKNFHQSQRLSGSNPRRLVKLISIDTRILKLIKSNQKSC